MKKDKGFTMTDSRKISKDILDEPAKSEDVKESLPKRTQQVMVAHYFARPSVPLDHPMVLIQTWANTLALMNMSQDQKKQFNKSIGVPDMTN